MKFAICNYILVRYLLAMCLHIIHSFITERNHNIRIPGFASDETRISLSQSTVAPTFTAATGKKNVQGTHMTLRSQRVAQVQQAKREAKLM